MKKHFNLTFNISQPDQRLHVIKIAINLFFLQALEHLRFEMDEAQLSHVIGNLEEIEKQIVAHCQ